MTVTMIRRHRKQPDLLECLVIGGALGSWQRLAPKIEGAYRSPLRIARDVTQPVMPTSTPGLGRPLADDGDAMSAGDCAASTFCIGTALFERFHGLMCNMSDGQNRQQNNESQKFEAKWTDLFIEFGLSDVRAWNLKDPPPQTSGRSIASRTERSQGLSSGIPDPRKFGAGTGKSR